jgi:hypothetical protein
MYGDFLVGGRLFHEKKSKEEFLMKEFWNSLQLIFAAVGGWLGYFPWRLRRIAYTRC